MYDKLEKFTDIIVYVENEEDVIEEIENGVMDYSNFIQTQSDLYDSIESSNRAVVNAYKSFFDIYRLVGFPEKYSKFSIFQLNI